MWVLGLFYSNTIDFSKYKLTQIGTSYVKHKEIKQSVLCDKLMLVP